MTVWHPRSEQVTMKTLAHSPHTCIHQYARSVVAIRTHLDRNTTCIRHPPVDELDARVGLRVEVPASRVVLTQAVVSRHRAQGWNGRPHSYDIRHTTYDIRHTTYDRRRRNQTKDENCSDAFKASKKYFPYYYAKWLKSSCFI